MIECAKMAFLGASPQLQKDQESQLVCCLRRESWGVQMLITHSSFFCVLLRERHGSQNQKPATM